MQVSNEPATQIRTYISSTSTDDQKIHISHRFTRARQAIYNCAATGGHGAAEISLIQFIGALVASTVAFKVEMSIVNVAVSKYLTNAFTFITDGM
jgi:hypothetical protein